MALVSSLTNISKLYWGNLIYIVCLFYVYLVLLVDYKILVADTLLNLSLDIVLDDLSDVSAIYLPYLGVACCWDIRDSGLGRWTMDELGHTFD